MRRQSADDVAEAARRRLALLAEELARAGLEPTRELGPEVDLGDDDGHDPRLIAVASRDLVSSGTLDTLPSEGPVEPVVARLPGRHSRRRPVPVAGRGAAWLQDRLPATLRGRVALGAGHVAVLAVVAAVALTVTAFVTIRARPTVTPVPEAHTSSASTLAARPSPVAASSALATGGPSPGEASTSGSVVVDVAGKVRRPGVATLPAGSRVVDAINKAGGARPGVDLSTLNLARVLVDGEQILVGVAAPAGVASSGSSQAGASDGALVNLNTATLEELDSLPGVGPVTAQKILEWRSAHGAFTSIDELLEVDGIGDKTLADMAPRLTL